MRIVAIRQSWPGNTGAAAFAAFRRMGHLVSAVVEEEYVPRWESLFLRGVRRALRPVLVRAFNDAVLRECEQLNAELLFVVKGEHVQAQTLRTLKKRHVTLICFFPDISVFNHGSLIPSALPLYDWIFTTKSFGPSDYRKQLGLTNVSYLPHAFDPEIHRPRLVSSDEQSLLGSDVSFIGGWSPGKERYLEAIRKNFPSINLRIWGDRWEQASGELRSIARPPIYGVAYATAIASAAINLGLLQDRAVGASSRDLITSRTFQIPACGGFLLHERTRDLLEIFAEDISCAAFESETELCAQIERFLANPEARKRIAQSGRSVVETAHSWDHRAATILERAGTFISGRAVDR